MDDERTPDFERALAHHEAGHLAVDIYFDHDVDFVSIDQHGEAMGVVQTDRSSHDALRYEDDLIRQVPFERMIMSALAGEIAQRKFAPESVDEEHAAGDRLLALEYFDGLDVQDEEILQAYWRVLELRTQALVDLLWSKVQVLAEALLVKRTLTGEAAVEVFTGQAYASK